MEVRQPTIRSGPSEVALGLLLVEEAVAFEEKPPLEALGRSWELARGNRFQLLIYWTAMLVLTGAGLCLCLVGVLLTGPWCRIAWFESYARLDPAFRPSGPGR
jgi:hypothetical protein